MSFQIGDDCIIDETATIKVLHGRIGPRTIIRAGAIIEGYHVEIGAESYLDIRARIGGGSCWDNIAYLKAGDWLHMGVDSHINTARGVNIGHEVGIGVETKIFTHGAYLPVTEGFPMEWDGVRIGDRVWLPHAWVNPGVVIGSNVVVAAMSLVNKSLPDGCFAAGIPAKVIKENTYPTSNTETIRRAVVSAGVMANYIYEDQLGGKAVNIMSGDRTTFMTDERNFIDIKNRIFTGPVTTFSGIFKNQLRRYGIRFRYYAKDGEYIPWETTP